MTPEALHMSNTCRWLTPPDVIEAARSVMGSISLDPASEEAGNKIVKASAFYSQSNSGLDSENGWFGNVWCNPPGDKKGHLPKAFWKRTLDEWRNGNIKQAMFLLFSLNQLQTLQDVEPPTNYPFLIFRKRLKFVNPDTMQSADQPAQGNALIYLPPKSEGAAIQLEGKYDPVSLHRFSRYFEPFGAITNPELKMNLQFNQFATNRGNLCLTNFF